MTFNTHTLPDHLAQYIESVFHFKGFMPDHSIERVVPTGHVFIIFELDGYERNTFDNDSLKPNATYTKVWISGMHKNYISISAHEDSEMFVIQFKPYGAHPFFHFPIQNLNDSVVHTEDHFGNELLSLREQILTKDTSEDKFGLAEAWLQGRFHADKAPPQELLAVLGQLQKEPAANYGEIISQYGNSQKHLIEQCKKYIGLTPKYYQRILRFNEILQKLHQEVNIPWAQIAYQSGYSDQSHFIKEFKHFSGFNPESFIKESFDMNDTNFFPLDREG